jgi:hypothetical protein
VLLGFRRRFAAFVEEGSKTHTIRGNRAIAPKAGEICHCYVDARQKTMRLLGRWPCVRVEPIRIEPAAHPARLVIRIDENALSDDETEALLVRDGFRDGGGETYPAMAQAREFWGNRLPLTGTLIHWDHSQPVEVSKRRSV